MKIIDKIKNFLFTEDKPIKLTSNWYSSLLSDNEGIISDDIVKGYEHNPYIFMIVDRIASIVASLPRQLVDLKTGKEFTSNSFEAKALKSLFQSPNSTENDDEFYYKLASNLLLGSFFVYKETAIGMSNSVPTRLISPISSDVTINEGNESPKSYSFNYFNVSYNNVEPSKMLHVFRPNISESTMYGLSTLKPASYLWQTSNEIFKSGYSLHKNKGVQGVLYGKGDVIMTPKEQQQMQEFYNKEFGNNSKMGKVRVSTSELGYLQMGVNPSDLQSVSMNLELLRTTCAMFGVSSQLFGDVAASTYSNMEEAQLAFYRDVVMPIAHRIDKELNRFVYNNDKFAYKVDVKSISILQKIKTELVANAIAMYSARLITIEEARAMIDEDFTDVPEILKRNEAQ